MGYVREGDLVVLHVHRRDRVRRYYIRPYKGRMYSTIAGSIPGERIIGLEWGSRIDMPWGHGYILKPTIADLVEGFYSRKSQVIYPKDSGYIALKAGLMPGMRVVEAGIGSGFLTTVAALHVCPTGRIYAYDTREDMITIALNNLKLAGLAECVDVKIGDVREGIEERGLDAGLLDMPDPWNALEALHKALKPSAPLVVFLPTSTQLDKLARALSSLSGWLVEETVEILKREIELVPDAVRPSPRMIGHTGYIVVLRRVGEA